MAPGRGRGGATERKSVGSHLLALVAPTRGGEMRGHVRKRHTREFIADIGRHPTTGRRRQKSRSGFSTKKEVESALHEFIRYIEGGGEMCECS